MFNYGGYKVIADKNIVASKKYPSGYKDGNRLGKRKRRKMFYPNYVTEGTIICSEEQYTLMLKEKDMNK